MGKYFKDAYAHIAFITDFFQGPHKNVSSRRQGWWWLAWRFILISCSSAGDI